MLTENRLSSENDIESWPRGGKVCRASQHRHSMDFSHFLFGNIRNRISDSDYPTAPRPNVRCLRWSSFIYTIAPPISRPNLALFAVITALQPARMKKITAASVLRARWLKGVRYRNQGVQARSLSGFMSSMTPTTYRNISFACGGILFGGVGVALAMSRGSPFGVETNCRSVLWEQANSPNPRSLKYANAETMLKVSFSSATPRLFLSRNRPYHF